MDTSSTLQSFKIKDRNEKNAQLVDSRNVTYDSSIQTSGDRICKVILSARVQYITRFNRTR